MRGGWEALTGEACKAVFSRSGEGLVFTEPHGGRVLGANPAACRLLGPSEDELRELGREGIVDPGDRGRWEAALARRDSVGYVEAELSVRRRDGSTFLAAARSAVFSDADGELRCCWLLQDVTAQRAEEAALRASEQLFRRLIATSNDAFVAMDAAGRITEWNHQAEVIFRLESR